MHNKTLSISVGICAYNEEKNIEYLLNSLKKQEADSVDIEQIIIVSDGSTDKTDEIVQSFNWNNKIRLVKLKERFGKYAAVNEFLKIAKSSILVLVSADTILDEEAIKNLCHPFLREGNLGMTGGHPIPINPRDSFIGYLVNLQWYLHHKLSLIQPKFGELIAFRNIINELPPTLVDEEQIACIIKRKGHELKYIPDAFVYNKGPDNIRDLLLQRRRIYAGHLMLKKEYNYEVTTFNGIRICKCLLTDLPLEYKKNKLWLLWSICVEIIARMLGRCDSIFKKKYYRWKIAKSTKGLN